MPLPPAVFELDASLTRNDGAKGAPHTVYYGYLYLDRDGVLLTWEAAYADFHSFRWRYRYCCSQKNNKYGSEKHPRQRLVHTSYPYVTESDKKRESGDATIHTWSSDNPRQRVT